MSPLEFAATPPTSPMGMVAGYFSGSAESKERSRTCVAAGNAPVSIRAQASKFVEVCRMRISLPGRARRGSVGGGRHQKQFLNAPRFDFRHDDLVRVAAIHHVDHLEPAELFAEIGRAHL